MATKSLYPDNFITVMTSDTCMQVEDKEKNILAASNLKWLANQLPTSNLWMLPRCRMHEVL